jgi:hypothetical protein
MYYVVGWSYHQVIDDLSVAHLHYLHYLQENTRAANWKLVKTVHIYRLKIYLHNSRVNKFHSKRISGKK